jgi:bifunctional DNA-binding transcriptional regulator/antitoxin component of YhaV-PrlF toxin-antitoxin module
LAASFSFCLTCDIAALDSSSATRYPSFPEVGISDFRKSITMSSIVKMQRKGQVTIPTRLRIQVGLVDGDWVEAKAERGKIVLTPKVLVDREYTPAQRRVIDARLAESLEQVKRGETFGLFKTHEEMATFLHREAKKARPKKTRSVKSRAR